MSLKTSPGQLEHLGLPGAWGRTSLNFRLVHSDDPCHLAHLSAVKIEPFWTIHLCGHRSKIIWDRDDLPTKNNYICGFQDQLGPTQIWTHSHILLVKSPIWSVKPCFWPSVQIFRQLDRILGWHYPSIPSMFHGQSPIVLGEIPPFLPRLWQPMMSTGKHAVSAAEPALCLW